MTEARGALAGRFEIGGSGGIAEGISFIGQASLSEHQVRLVLRPGTPLPSIDEVIAAQGRGFDTSKYDADPRCRSLIEDFAKQHGLRVDEIDLHRCIATLTGASRELEHAFGVSLGIYALDGVQFLGHEGSVSLPLALQDVVTWVYGLDQHPIVKSARTPALASGAEPVPSTSTTRSYFVTELMDHYDFPREYTGKGVCIGLIELTGGYDEKGVAKYFETLGLPRPEVVCWNENVFNPNDSSFGAVSQDIEIVGTVVPEALVAVYNRNSQTCSLSDYYETFHRAIHDDVHRPSVLINNWVFVENPLDLDGIGINREQARIFEDLFTRAALEGITICSASGNTGALYSLGFTPSERTQAGTAVGGLAVPFPYYPASSPWVLGVGGTSLYMDRSEEVVYNRLSTLLAFGGMAMAMGASSGGVSQLFERPAYQQSAGGPEVQCFTWSIDAGLVEQPAVRGRGVPDVASDADVTTGCRLVLAENWIISGGTGIAVPLWGGLVVQLVEAAGGRLGLLQPLLYRLQIDEEQGVFQTIYGDNGGFRGPPGEPWNPCAGLGVPRGRRLAEKVKSARE